MNGMGAFGIVKIIQPRHRADEPGCSGKEFESELTSFNAQRGGGWLLAHNQGFSNQDFPNRGFIKFR